MESCLCLSAAKDVAAVPGEGICVGPDSVNQGTSGFIIGILPGYKGSDSQHLRLLLLVAHQNKRQNVYFARWLA